MPIPDTLPAATDPFPVGASVVIVDYDGQTRLGPFTVARSYWPQPVVELDTPYGLVRENHDRLSPARLCGEVLYDNGRAVAYCNELHGVEHDHSDRTVSERLDAGTAVALPDDTTLTVEVWFLHGEVVEMRVQP